MTSITGYIYLGDFDGPSPSQTLTIADGVYTIRSGMGTSYAVDVSGMSKANWANIQLWESTLAENQQFRFKRNSDGSYTITGVYSGLAIDVNSGSTASGANVIQYQSNGGANQHWYVEDAGDGMVYLRNQKSGCYLDVANGTLANTANVQQYTFNGSAAQKFQLVPHIDQGTRSTALATGYYVLRSKGAPSFAIDYQEDSPASGTNVLLFTCKQDDKQVLHIVKLDDGTYRISPKASDKVAFDVEGASCANGANVRIWKASGSLAQRWILRDMGNGAYAFQNAASGLYLDVYGAEYKDGTNIWQYQGNGNAAQQFIAQAWDRKVSSSRVTTSGVAKSYEETGSAITPKPTVRWLVNSQDSVRVPSSGTASYAYANRVLAVGRANHTYVIEIDAAKRIAGSAEDGRIRAVDADGKLIGNAMKVAWSTSTQTIKIKPTIDCRIYLYPAKATDTNGTSAQFTGVRVYEELIAGSDYKLAYQDNVAPGKAQVKITGAGLYSGSKSISFTITAKPKPDPEPEPRPEPTPGPGEPSDPPSGPPADDPNVYNDIKPGSYYEQPARHAISQGWFSGEQVDAAHRAMRPSSALKRGEVAQLLYNMAGAPVVGVRTNAFADVDASSECADAVEWCFSKGIVTGKSDTVFDPFGDVTRQQFVTMLARFAANIDQVNITGTAASLAPYKDSATVQRYAVSTLAWAVDAKIYGQGTNELTPTANVTRAQGITMVYRYKQP